MSQDEYDRRIIKIEEKYQDIIDNSEDFTLLNSIMENKKAEIHELTHLLNEE
jgi:hypothetical protein